MEQRDLLNETDFGMGLGMLNEQSMVIIEEDAENDESLRYDEDSLLDLGGLGARKF